MNKQQLIGNLGRDASIKTGNGKDFLSFPLAVDESYKNKAGEKVEKTTWFNCTTQQVNLAKYLTKGVKIFIEGSTSAKLYEDKEGNKVASLNLSAREIKLLSFKDNIETVVAEVIPNGTEDDLPF